MEMFSVSDSSMAAINHTRPLGTRNLASVIEELEF